MAESIEKPELMSPAGGWPQLRAAIEAGADAVYFGLDHLSARAKVGFAVQELPEVISALHERGVKGFVTFNTIVFDGELQKAARSLESIALAGTDAVIVQDVGIARLARAIAPEMAVHGSTQMTVTSPQGAEFAKSLGCSRVVLARELSIRDIEKFRPVTDVELEVFVHGALCVSYSGQCFSSEAWGGRSANRGQCAQACRLSYELIVDGQRRDTGSDRYLLSPGDLYAVDHVPKLMELGIACLKIEGRYKDANYVALTTRAYRQAIDRAAGISKEQDVSRKHLEQIYSRGLGDYFISGVNHQNVVRGRAPRHRGLLLGRVTTVGPDFVTMDAGESVSPGDGIVFDAADWRSPDENEEGGNVYHAEVGDDDLVKLTFGSGQIDFSRIQVGDFVWRTHDPKIVKTLKSLAKPSAPVRTDGISFEITTAVDQPLHVRAFDDFGNSTATTSDQPLAVADHRGLNRETLQKQLGRLGGTPFHLAEIIVHRLDDKEVFLPVSELNRIRRELVDGMVNLRKNVKAHHVHSPTECLNQLLPARSQATNSNESQLHLLVRTSEQLDAAIDCAPASITLDYLELYGLRPSVEKIVAAGLNARVASPRVLKPAEQNVVRFLLSLNCDIVVRSAGLLHEILKLDSDERPRLIGDFSLNIANAISASEFLKRGVDIVTPTHDLNAKQIQELAQRVDASALEVIVYQHLPVFHMEHCVFCRFLSDGTDNTNCGHPCETHRLAVRDQQGRDHPVMADVGCRNTVFGCEAQVGTEYIQDWLANNICNFRLEFAHENGEQVIAAYRTLRESLKGNRSAEQLSRDLARFAPGGVTRGSLVVLGERTRLT